MNQSASFSAIICELNPLHYGHAYILRHAASLGCPVVCVMSGNYVQRGDMAILDKWTRAELALQYGAELVIELPLPWAMAGAQRFAAGGIRLLHALGLPGNLVFGAENSDCALLTELAGFLCSQRYHDYMKRHMQTGQTFAAVREQAVCELLGTRHGEALQTPNNILATEYLRAIRIQGAPLSPIVLRRTGAAHDQPPGPGEYASAGEIRKRMLLGQEFRALLPKDSLHAVEAAAMGGRCPASLSRVEPAVLSRLRQMQPADFYALPDISEGLEYRLYHAARTACSLNEFYDAVKSKRYTHARIRRLTLSAFLGLTKAQPALPPYLRILGMTHGGAALLKAAKPMLPIAVRPKDFRKLSAKALSLYQLEAACDDLFALAMPTPQPCGMDYQISLRTLWIR